MEYCKLSLTDAPREWHGSLRLANELFLPLLKGRSPLKKGFCITFKKGKDERLSVLKKEGQWSISAPTLPQAMRGFAFALAGMELEESCVFSSAGIMLDASRNRVFHVSFLKRLILLLALAGYDHFMLYLEDVYELPDEPAFGFMRGRYSSEELKECNAFAASLGIRMIPCIQTLGHMENLLKHSQYAHIKDTSNILLADEEATYSLIEKMLTFWQQVLPGGEIHVGMDEVSAIGRGRFLEKYGLQDRKEILLRHLQKVASLCEKYGFTPMIWADMLLHGEKPLDELKKAMPEKIKLYHWDYSGTVPEKYTEAFERLAPLNKEITMTGSVYSYNVFSWVPSIMERVIPPSLTACRENHIKRYLLSVWGDAGSFCCAASWTAGLFTAASLLRGHTQEKAHSTSLLLVKYLMQEDYSFFLQAGELGMIVGKRPLPSAGLFWEDPIQGSVYGYCCTAFPEEMKKYKKVLEKIVKKGENLSRRTNACKLLTTLAKTMLELLLMREKLLESYRKNDNKELERLRKEMIPQCRKDLAAFDRLFREEWLSSGKVFGLEIIQRRNMGVYRRLEELSMQLKELLHGKRDSLPELDEALKVFEHPENIVIPPVFSGSLEIY